MSGFQSEVVASVHLVRCPAQIDQAAVAEFAAKAPPFLGLEVKLHVLDFSECRAISALFYPALTEFKRGLQDSNRALLSIHLSDRLLDQIHRDGVDSVFAPYTTLQEALQRTGLTTLPSPGAEPKTDTDLLRPVVEGVKAAIQMLGGQAPTDEPAAAEGTPRSPDELQIVLGATMDLNNDATHGGVALYICQSALRDLHERITRQTFESAQVARTQDLMREILNMALGKAKAEWKMESGYQFERTLPRALTDEPLKAHAQEFLSGATVVPLSTPNGKIYVGLTLKPRVHIPPALS